MRESKSEVEKTEGMSDLAIVVSLQRLVWGHACEMVNKLKE